MRVAIVTSAEDRETLQTLLDCTFLLDCLYLRKHPDTPWLMESGVAYRREPREVSGIAEGTEERFLAVDETMAQGWGDCDDLAPWRAAEIVVRYGGKARPEIVPIGPGQWHVVVWTDRGYEDPCAELGMVDPQITYEERQWLD